VTVTAGLSAVLKEACRQAGISSEGAEPIRLGENAIFRLPGRVVARIARPGQQDAAQREVAVSRWLSTAGVPAVTARSDVEQPVEADGRSVTFWDELPPHTQGTLPQVAAVLRRLHSLPVPDDVPLGALNPFVRLRERIGQASALPGDDRAWLTGRLAELEGQWTVLRSSMPPCVIHGDAWTGNIVATSDGQVILLDLERCSIGPPEWDLVSSAVKYVTYGQVSAAEWQQFCAAYGRDVTTWANFPVILGIRELRMTCYAAQQAAADPHLAGEARLRVACLRGHHGHRPWPWSPL
jgi:aminoglycoside phosphotransferase